MRSGEERPSTLISPSSTGKADVTHSPTDNQMVNYTRVSFFQGFSVPDVIGLRR